LATNKLSNLAKRLLFFFIGIPLLIFVLLSNYNYIIISIAVLFLVGFITLEINMIYGKVFDWNKRKDKRYTVNDLSLNRLNLLTSNCLLKSKDKNVNTILVDISLSGLKLKINDKDYKDESLGLFEDFEILLNTKFGIVLYSIRLIKKAKNNENIEAYFVFNREKDNSYEDNFYKILQKKQKKVNYIKKVNTYLKPFILSLILPFLTFLTELNVIHGDTINYFLVLCIILAIQKCFVTDIEDFIFILPNLFIELCLLIYPSLFALYIIKISFLLKKI